MAKCYHPSTQKTVDTCMQGTSRGELVGRGHTASPAQMCFDPETDQERRHFEAQPLHTALSAFLPQRALVATSQENQIHQNKTTHKPERPTKECQRLLPTTEGINSCRSDGLQRQESATTVNSSCQFKSQREVSTTTLLKDKSQRLTSMTFVL